MGNEGARCTYPRSGVVLEDEVAALFLVAVLVVNNPVPLKTEIKRMLAPHPAEIIVKRLIEIAGIKRTIAVVANS